MVDIFITGKCNLNCSYCFSKEYVNQIDDEISIENFVKIVNFNKTLSEERLGIAGGEPSLHSKFKELIHIVKNDDGVNNCLVFSNGIELCKYTQDLHHPKFITVINCNSPADIGQSRYKKLKKTIDSFYKMNNNFILGLNLYSLDFDYSYIFDLLKLSDKHELRFSIALSSKAKEEEKDVFGFFERARLFLNKFIIDCYDNEIVPWNDCNTIPQCLLTVEDKRIQLKSVSLAKKYNIDNHLIRATHTCKPIITVFSDLCAIRSMCYPNCEKVPIANFSSVTQLRKYLSDTVDAYADMAFFKEECKTCRYRIIGKCGLCMIYKAKQTEKIKKMKTKKTTKTLKKKNGNKMS